MFANQKECSPTDTIQHIRSILYQHGIVVREKEWFENGEKLFSVILQIEGTFRNTNGKGVSVAFALASAYGELMERLQNLRFLPKEDFSLLPDKRVVRLGSIIKNKNLVCRGDLKSSFSAYLVQEYNVPVECVPLYHYNSRTLVDLPRFVVDRYSSSNGMCAGNTAEEALVQGISECFERHVIQKIFFEDRLNFPIVPISKIKNLPSYPLLQEVEKTGYRVVVRDCSCSGKFPVVGCFFINEELSQYAFHIGASPVFDTALQRCITEIFQGCRGWSSKGSPLGIIKRHMFSERESIDDYSETARIVNLEKQRTKSQGMFLSHIMHGYGKDCIDKIFVKKVKSNKELLRHLLRSAIDNKLDLFVRDVSYLGFPAFRVYIPGLEPKSPKDIEQRLFMITLPKLIERIDRLNKRELEKLMSNIISIALPRFPLLSSVGQKKGILLCLISLCIRLKRYDLVSRYGMEYKDLIAEFADDEKIRYIRCFIMIAKLKHNGLNFKEILESLRSLYGGNLVREISHTMTQQERGIAKKNIILSEAVEGENIYKQLREVSRKMIETKIDQAKLDGVFY